MDNGQGVISINYINSEISSSPSTWIPSYAIYNRSIHQGKRYLC